MSGATLTDVPAAHDLARAEREDKGLALGTTGVELRAAILERPDIVHGERVARGRYDRDRVLLLVCDGNSSVCRHV